MNKCRILPNSLHHFKRQTINKTIGLMVDRKNPIFLFTVYNKNDKNDPEVILEVYKVITALDRKTINFFMVLFNCS